MTDLNDELAEWNGLISDAEKSAAESREKAIRQRHGWRRNVNLGVYPLSIRLLSIHISGVQCNNLTRRTLCQ
jgi:hypothetical protein